MLACPQETLQERLLLRGRGDDDKATIGKRIKTFQTTTAEVLSKYEAAGKVRRISADASADEVFARVQEALLQANIQLSPLFILEIDAIDCEAAEMV